MQSSPRITCACTSLVPIRPSRAQRKAEEVARDFRRVFIALWGDRPITSISKGDVLGLIESVRDNGTPATLAAYGKGERADKRPAPGQARNLLGHLKTFFGWAVERDIYEIWLLTGWSLVRIRPGEPNKISKLSGFLCRKLRRKMGRQLAD